jgi:uncharacterized delta-60 repeat protein
MRDRHGASVSCEALEHRRMLSGAGELDRDYGVNGRQGFQVDRRRYERNGTIEHVLFRPDGRITTVGQASRTRAILRQYDPAGRFDSGFGHVGARYADMDHFGFNHGAQLQPDGKVLHLFRHTLPISGAPGKSRLRRYHDDGRLDASFGRRGEALIAYRGRADWAWAFTLQPDGTIRLFGTRETRGPGGVPRVFIVQAKLTARGRLDRSFGRGGFVETRYPRRGDFFLDLMPRTLSDGRIVLLAEWEDFFADDTRHSRVLMRFDEDGSLDESFGDEGRVIVPHLSEQDPFAVDLEPAPDGSILVVTNGAIWRYRADGDVDRRFGDEGRFELRAGDGFGALEVQEDGRILVAYSGEGGDDDDVIVDRLTQWGQRDRSFGRNGMVGINWAGEAYVSALELTDDGAVWVGGSQHLGARFSERLVVARVLV